MQKVRGRVGADPIAAGTQHAFEQRAGRALAGGAADGDHRALEHHAETRVDRADAVEPHRDRLRMERLEIREPFGERRVFFHRFTGAATKATRDDAKERFSPRGAAVAATRSAAWADHP